MNQKLIYSALILAGFVVLLRIFTFYAGIEKYPPGSVITWQTRVFDQPRLKTGGQQVSVSMPNSQRILVKFKLIPVVSYGDEILIRGKVDYFELEGGDKVAFMNYPQFVISERGSESNILFKAREKIIDFFNSSLPRTYSALMLGIVFGIKEEMDPEFYIDLQKVGLMHVIAASGMNITMLGGFLSLFFALFLKRQLAIFMTVVGIIFYAVLAGLEPSIVRAAIMGILVFLAQLTGRQNSSFLALAFAGFIMLMRSPSLVLDIGFQLSFLATLGLIYVRPLFGLIPAVKRLGKNVITEDLTTTLSAQIATLPILIANFGSYSLWSIPANAIVLWTVPFLMIIGGISAIIAFVFEPLGRTILYFSVPFLLYFTKIVDIFANLGGQLEIKSVPIFMILGYYLIVIAIALLVRRWS